MIRACTRVPVGALLIASACTGEQASPNTGIGEPVRIAIDHVPPGVHLLVGRTASVDVLPGEKQTKPPSPVAARP